MHCVRPKIDAKAKRVRIGAKWLIGKWAVRARPLQISATCEALLQGVCGVGQTIFVEKAAGLMEEAFSRLAQRPGFVNRPDQAQIAMLIGDCMAERATGCFEAPTGLGKSLAALVPAIAHAIAHDKRSVVATYTNVLAEQYWHSDLPLALSLFDERPDCRFLIGRSRYACLLAMDEHSGPGLDLFRKQAELGIETEFRGLVRGRSREVDLSWRAVATPPACPARFCPAFDDCFYYSARRAASEAHLIITNHSVVLQDAQLRAASDGDLSMLGDYDLLIVDEAHDFAAAAANALEFELSANALSVLAGIAGRYQEAVGHVALAAREQPAVAALFESFRKELETAGRTLSGSMGVGIVVASPPELMQEAIIRTHALPGGEDSVKGIALRVEQAIETVVEEVEILLRRWQDEERVDPRRIREVRESTRNYVLFLRSHADGCRGLFAPTGVSVSYAGGTPAGGPRLRYDAVGLAEPLTDLIWDRTPWVCLSATLAVDGGFDFFEKTTGASAMFKEVLPTPFDFSTQAALYLPPPGRIPDPAVARRDGCEEAYYYALAMELEQIIEMVGGRTLALFHSRREMEAVHRRLAQHPERPVYIQTKSGGASVGERFKREMDSSLFALRSFWTGFDAPGETLSCVAIARIPFEVPLDPPQVVRGAWLLSKGLNPFLEYSLPTAKTMIRQAAGRLIRSGTDKGLIAILDPRVQTKRYGEEILQNLPSELTTYYDLADAVGRLGIASEPSARA